jgi:hypothetical protein
VCECASVCCKCKQICPRSRPSQPSNPPVKMIRCLPATCDRERLSNTVPMAHGCRDKQPHISFLYTVGPYRPPNTPSLAVCRSEVRTRVSAMHAGCEGGKRTFPMASNGVRRKSISPAGPDAGIASGLVPAMRTVWSKARVLTATPLQGRLWVFDGWSTSGKERVLVGTHVRRWWLGACVRSVGRGRGPGSRQVRCAEVWRVKVAPGRAQQDVANGDERLSVCVVV